DPAGQPVLASLALHTGEIRGFDLGGGTVSFNAQDILIDNSANGSGLGAIAPNDGSLTLNANTIQLGSNQTSIDQFSGLTFNTTNGFFFKNTGGWATGGSLTINPPVFAGATAASETITAAGAVDIEPIAGAIAKVTGGLGANLTIA